MKGVGILFRENLKLYVLVEGAAQIVEEAAILGGLNGVRKDAGFASGAIAIRGGHFGDQSRIGEAGRNGLGDFDRRGAFGEFLHAAIGKCYVNLVHRDRPDTPRFSARLNELEYRRAKSGSRRPSLVHRSRTSGTDRPFSALFVPLART